VPYGAPRISRALLRADPATGEGGYYGDFYEFNGTLFGVMALRLKVQDPRIIEVKVIVARQRLRPVGVCERIPPA
jgi:hypothetical protein